MRKLNFFAFMIGLPIVASAQNVGIGTATPDASAKLDIVDANRGFLFPRVSLTATNVAAPVSSPANWLVVFNNATAGSGATAVSPGLYYWDGTQWVRLLSGNTNNNWLLDGNTNGALRSIGTNDNLDLPFETNGGERMRLTTAGNLGIGTSTPDNRLELTNGGMQINGDWGIGFGGEMPSGATAPIGDAGRMYYMLTGLTATPSDDFLVIEKTDINDNPPDGGIAFTNVGSTNARTVSMVIRGNGNVGINTTAPAERLHVVGNIRSSTLANPNNRLGFSDANGTLANIAAGTNGQVLRVVGGVPAWAAPVSNNWSLTGNAGTVDGTNFLGTTDGVPLTFRVNNQRAGRIELFANGSVFFGIQAGLATTGTGNTGIGSNALLSNTSGYDNVAVGNGAIRSNTTGVHNVGIGSGALNSSTTAMQNVAVGSSALFATTTGGQNTALGLNAGSSNTVGTNNTVVGFNALGSNVAGSRATAIGHSAMQFQNSSATAFTNTNVAVGFEAMVGNPPASANTGNDNTAIGYQSLRNNSTGGWNTALGMSALNANTTASFNTALGRDAMALNTTGDQNTAVGVSALRANSSGFGNVAVGVNALAANTTAQQNTAVGYYALLTNSTGTRNTAIGESALRSNTFGNDNEAHGLRALFSNTTGNQNSGMGSGALLNVTTGANNTGVGYQAGSGLTTGSSNTFLGANTSATAALTNATAVGANTALTQSNTVILGSNADVGIGTSTPITRLDVNGGAWFRSIGTTAAQHTYVMTSPSVQRQGGLIHTQIGANTAGTFGFKQYTIGTGTTQATTTFGLALVDMATPNTMLLDNLLTFRGNGIAAFGAIPIDNSAQLEVSASNRGVLLPRVSLTSTTDVATIASPTTSLLVYNTATAGAGATAVTPGYYYWDGAQWLRFQAANTNTNWTLTGNAGTVDGTNFLGTTDNVALNFRVNGQRAGRVDNAGGSSAFFGYLAGNANTGNNNTGMGRQALAATTIGGQNTALGSQAMVTNTSGYNNTAIGSQALQGNTIGINNVAIGAPALTANTSGNSNIAIGNNAANANLTSSNGIFIGENAGRLWTTGNGPLAIGYNAGFSYTGYGGGAWNVSHFIGNSAGYSNTSGVANLFVGNNAGYANATGSYNTAIGQSAGSYFTNTSYNTMVGYAASGTGSTGGSNTFIGARTGDNNTTGSNNVVVGDFAFATNTTGSNNTVIGSGSNVGSAALTNATAIGANAVVNTSNSVVLGNSANVGINTSSPSARLHLIGEMLLNNNTANNSILNLSSTGSFFIQSNGTTRFNMSSAGNIGIWTTPSTNYALQSDYQNNAGSGYGVGAVRSAFFGNGGGAAYNFGVAAYQWGITNRSGALHGAYSGATWGALGYTTSGGTGVGAYFTAAASTGAGYMPNKNVQTGIALASYGGVMGGWVRGEVMGLATAGTVFASYNMGNEYTSGHQADIVTTNGERRAAFANTSTTLKVYADGYGQLANGQATVRFEADFAALAAAGKPVVTVSAVGSPVSLYIKRVDKDGFEVATVDGSAANVEFSWTAVAKRVDAEAAKMPKELQDARFDERLDGVMFNENNTERNAQPIWWDGDQLRYDAAPIDPEKAKENELKRPRK